MQQLYSAYASFENKRFKLTCGPENNFETQMESNPFDYYDITTALKNNWN